MTTGVVRVRMAEYSVEKSPTRLITIGLGSCVGVAIYDRSNKIGGLIHIMLPENKKGVRPAKFADTGIPLLIEKMEEMGAVRWKMNAKIAGGAHMFSSADRDLNIKVGDRNIEAVRNVLSSEKIDIIGEDVGKNYGRTIEFNTENGEVLVRSYKTGNKYL